jgi:hypothetical protein
MSSTDNKITIDNDSVQRDDNARKSPKNGSGDNDTEKKTKKSKADKTDKNDKNDKGDKGDKNDKGDKSDKKSKKSDKNDSSDSDDSDDSSSKNASKSNGTKEKSKGKKDKSGDDDSDSDSDKKSSKKADDSDDDDDDSNDKDDDNKLNFDVLGGKDGLKLISDYLAFSVVSHISIKKKDANCPKSEPYSIPGDKFATSLKKSLPSKLKYPYTANSESKFLLSKYAALLVQEFHGTMEDYKADDKDTYMHTINYVYNAVKKNGKPSFVVFVVDKLRDHGRLPKDNTPFEKDNKYSKESINYNTYLTQFRAQIKNLLSVNTAFRDGLVYLLCNYFDLLGERLADARWFCTRQSFSAFDLLSCVYQSTVFIHKTEDTSIHWRQVSNDLLKEDKKAKEKKKKSSKGKAKGGKKAKGKKKNKASDDEESGSDDEESGSESDAPPKPKRGSAAKGKKAAAAKPKSKKKAAHSDDDEDSDAGSDSD